MKVQHVDNHNPPSSISSSPQLTILIRGEPLGDTLCKSALRKSNNNPRNTSIVQIQALANWETEYKQRLDIWTKFMVLRICYGWHDIHN